ncbi:MAG: serine/threonine protein kinase, partial [Phycisphaerales bacterium]|nr:serine/threonine protein kinase [Phycisphaerales bacterium]
LDAVQHAHVRGVIHRDLKPSNILVDPEGRPHVLDFGLAKFVDSTGTSHSITHTNQFLGTLAYAAPEQVRSDPEGADVRSDVYALGLMLHEMLTGRRFIDVDMPITEAIRFVTEVEPPRLRSLGREFDPELSTIVQKAVAKDRTRRYQSIEAFAGDLARYQSGEAILAHPPSTWYQVRKLVERHRFASALGGAAAVLVVGLATTSTVLAIRTERARRDEVAQHEASDALVRKFQDLLSSETYEQFEVRLLDEYRRATDPDVRLDMARQLAGTLGLSGSNVAASVLFNDIRGALLGRHEAPILTQVGDASPDLWRARLNEWIRTGDEDDPSAIDARRNLARHLYRDGQYEEAAREATRVLDLATARYGARSRDVAGIRLLLGDIDLAQRRTADAVTEYRTALSITSELLDPRHLRLIHAGGSLALALALDGRLEDAAQLYERILDMGRERLGESHPTLTTTKSRYAAVLEALDRPDDAARLLEEILATIDTPSAGSESDPPHLALGRTLEHLAIVCHKAGRSDEAIRHGARLVEVRRREGDPVAIADASVLLAAVLIDGSRLPDAALVLREAVKGREDDPIGAFDRLLLAHCEGDDDALALLGDAFAGSSLATGHAEAYALLTGE